MADVPASKPAVANIAPMTVCAYFFMVYFLFMTLEQQIATL
jgi:hypothetical protein